MTKTRADIIASISKGTGIPVKEVRTVIEAFLEEIKGVYYTNDRIEFRGFGVFGNKFRKGRIGRNPRTNEEVKIPGRWMPTFKPSKVLKREIEKKVFPED
ncbi:MAG: integration host factor subunit beta [candidate division WOR-3 bacterium]|jgi:nucleoid DNA-binding protein